MGFITGVITGIAAAAIAAAWYLSRSGERIRTQYRIEDRLAQLGDELEARTRDLQGLVQEQLADLRGASDAEVPLGETSDAAVTGTLDPVAASAAEAEAAAAADAAATDDAPTKRTRRPKAAAPDAAEQAGEG